MQEHDLSRGITRAANTTRLQCHHHQSRIIHLRFICEVQGCSTHHWTHNPLQADAKSASDAKEWKSHTRHNRKTLVSQNAKPESKKQTIYATHFNLCYTFTHINRNLANVGMGERFFATSAPDTPECPHKRKRDNATRCENKCWDLRMRATAKSSFDGHRDRP